MNRIRQLWSNLRSSFWLMPSLIVVAFIVFAVVLIKIDSSGNNQWMARWPHVFGSGAEGARGMMSTIAGSMMSVVGVTFSMVLVVLALASSQYTSRILRNFMRSRVTQVMLGIFAGIFTYCLIVLRTIRSDNEVAFVPNLAVSFGLVMALGGVGALIFFIHHIAASIQASKIISSVAQETIETIDRQFPDELGQMPDEDEEQKLPPLPKANWWAVPAIKSGYIQNVNFAMLLRMAHERKTVVRLEYGIGEFVVRNTALFSLASEKPPDQLMITAFQKGFSIDHFRTVEQDAAFGIRQIVDVALKALSPGINDTTTSVTCIDYLTSILANLASRQIPSSYQFEKGELRLITKYQSFENLLNESFDQIRNNAKGNVTIILQMLNSIQTLTSLTASPRRRQALNNQVQWIIENSDRSVDSIHDRAKINKQLEYEREIPEARPVSFEREGNE